MNSIQSFLDYFAKVRGRTERLVRIVPPDRLEWTYMPGKFTIGDQIRHIAAIERYMFAETIAGRVSAYHGCGKNLADGYENVVAWFNELHRQSMEIFGHLSDEDMPRKCMTPGNAEMPIWKWLRSMIEHEVHHRGNLYVYLNLLEIKTPPLYGLTSEEVAERSVWPPTIAG